MAIPYTFHNKLILRTPRLPLNAQTNGGHIQALLDDKSFLEAIYLASPVLYDECIKWKEGLLTDKKGVQKLIRSLSKYYTRMTSRCTPFGLFSGCAVTNWHPEQTRVVVEDNIIQRHTRFDMHYLCALAQKLALHTGIKEKLLYYPNNSIYTIGDEIRYVEYQYINGKRSHQISSVNFSEYVEAILKLAESGSTYQQMIDQLCSDEITEEEAIDFVGELISSQLLVNELEPAITGNEFIYQVLETLQRINTDNNEGIALIIDVLQQADRLLKQLDETADNDAARYREIMTLLNKLDVPYEESKLFQTDVTKVLEENNIHASIQEELMASLDMMNKISGERENDNLQSFARRFYERYEDKEMPLLEVLDTETGIGYLEHSSGDITPLVEDIVPPNKQAEYKYGWGNLEKLLSQKLALATKENQAEIILTDADLKDFTGSWDNLPPSMSVMFRLVNKETNTIYIESAGGSSAANLLGRFAHADDAINNIVCDVTKAEQLQNPDVVFAEIIHLPESRIGNILLHPAFREYEIPYLAKSSLPDKQQVQVKDLYVSVKSGKIFLYSKILGKQIIPRLSTAHNYSYNALPVYQFLCDLQLQGKKGGVGFSWGSLQGQHNILPRVLYKNTILHLASWTLAKKDIEPLTDKTGDKLKDAIQSFRSLWKLPRYVVLADSDNELLVDFDNELLVQTWLESVKNRSAVILKEFLLDTSSGVTNKNNQSYTNQLVAILVRNTPAYTAPPALAASLTPAVQRKFSPGSQWLYYKLYCGIKTADKILLDAIKPLTEQLAGQQLVDKWFFIRYNDPAFHIRLRLHIPDSKNVGEVITATHQCLAAFEKDGYIWKLQLDTYNRELERYGVNTIDLAEEFFYYDSVALLKMLDLTWGDEREKIRWLWALRSVDELLNCFQFTLDEKLSLLTVMKDSFAKEFNMDKSLRLQLNNKSRDNKLKIEQIMDNTRDTENELYPLIEVLIDKSTYVSPIAEKLQKMQKSGTLHVAIPDLLSSYIHMVLNRITTSNPRLHEMVIYDFLFRHYQSQKARQKMLLKTE
jgi:lantibiotic biosynthesis protein